MLFLKESLNLRLEIKNSTGALFYETNTDIDLILPLFSDEHLCDSEGFFHKKHEALSVFHESNKKEKKPNLIGLNGSTLEESFVILFQRLLKQVTMWRRKSVRRA